MIVYGIEAWGDLPRRKSQALLQADRLIGISDFSRDVVVKRHKVDVNRFVSLPCALDDSLLSLPLAQVSAGVASIPDRCKLMLTVARMASNERYKGHDEILKALPAAIARVPDLFYAIVGGGDNVPRLKQLTESVGVGKHVIFTGEITDSELATLYQRCDVFVLPARTVIDNRQPKGEGFGIVYLEAMAFGKPVIGPNHGAPVEVIEHGKTGLLVDPSDSAALAQALIYLLSHPDKARKMGDAGRKRVTQQFSYQRFRERLQELISGSAAEALSRSSDAHLESDTSVYTPLAHVVDLLSRFARLPANSCARGIRSRFSRRTWASARRDRRGPGRS